MRVTRILLVLALIATAPFPLFAQGTSAKGSAAAKNATPERPAAGTSATQSPTAAETPAPGAQRAKCKDGSMYSGASRQGAFSSHGGVGEWLTTASSAGPKGATARCNDGTFYSKAERQGACSGHKGVAEWLKQS